MAIIWPGIQLVFWFDVTDMESTENCECVSSFLHISILFVVLVYIFFLPVRVSEIHWYKHKKLVY